MADEVQTEDTGAEADAAPIVEETALPSIEDLARELKWKPKEEWAGPEDEWRDAAEYIRAGQNGKLVKQVKVLTETTERMARTAAQTTARMLAEQEAEIVARFEQAVEDGDKVEAAKATRDLQRIEREKAEVSPETEFARENPWYTKDEDATAYAVAISQREAAKGKSVSEQLEAARAGVMKRFPELFEGEEPARPRLKAPQVAAPTTRTAAAPKRAKGANDLPPAAKSAGMEFVRMATEKGRAYTIDDYARTYWSEQGEVAA